MRVVSSSRETRKQASTSNKGDLISYATQLNVASRRDKKNGHDVNAVAQKRRVAYKLYRHHRAKPISKEMPAIPPVFAAEDRCASVGVIGDVRSRTLRLLTRRFLGGKCWAATFRQTDSPAYLPSEGDTSQSHRASMRRAEWRLPPVIRAVELTAAKAAIPGEFSCRRA